MITDIFLQVEAAAERKIQMNGRGHRPPLRGWLPLIGEDERLAKRVTIVCTVPAVTTAGLGLVTTPQLIVSPEAYRVLYMHASMFEQAEFLSGPKSAPHPVVDLSTHELARPGRVDKSCSHFARSHPSSCLAWHACPYQGNHAQDFSRLTFTLCKSFIRACSVRRAESVTAGPACQSD